MPSQLEEKEHHYNRGENDLHDHPGNGTRTQGLSPRHVEKERVETEARESEGAGQDPPSSAEAGQPEQDPKPVDPATRRRRLALGMSLGAVVLIGIVGWWLYSRTYEDTDDAQVDTHINPIAARVNGTVVAVYTEDNQAVQAGQPLVDLDSNDAAVQVAQARANYEQALAQLNAEDPNLAITITSNLSDLSTAAAEVANAKAALSEAQRDYESSAAKLRQAQATNLKSQNDLIRYKKLLDQQEIAPSDYDQYLSQAHSEEANVDSSKAAAEAARQSIEERQAQLDRQQAKYAETSSNAPRQVVIKHANLANRKASVDSAKAQLDQALLNLQYCHVLAPVSGILMHRSAEVGGRISSGQQLFMIAQTASPWVTANFKETQVRKMRVGQPVKIKVDALDKTFQGTVESMPASTGDRASVLPAENATGNFVKVVERLPVRIHINPGQQGMDQLRPGMSVEPTVSLD